MDELRRLFVQLHTVRPMAPGVGLLLTVLIVTGCLRSASKDLTPFAPTQITDLAKRVAALRHLPLKRELTLKSASESIPLINEYYGALPIQQVERDYKSIGMLSADTKLTAALTEYRRIENLIQYDGSAASIALSRDAAAIGRVFEQKDPRAAHEIPAVLAILMALQEQHFNWSAIVDVTLSEDRRLALRALAAGDAMFTAITRTDAGDSPTLTAAGLATAYGVAGQLDRLGAGIPDFLRRQLSFPYREGISFVYWAYTAKGWDGVNALYADPPLTTAEILHPEKYFLRRARSLRLFPAGFLRRMKVSSTLEQSFGEYLISVLLESEYSAKDAAVLSAAWRGDRLFSFQDGANAVTAWYSTWENDRAATNFNDAYRTVLETRQRIRFRPAVQSKSGFLMSETRDRGAFALQVNGSNVVFLHATPPSRVSELADELWKDIEIDPELKVIPFESARTGNQLSFSRR